MLSKPGQQASKRKIEMQKLLKMGGRLSIPMLALVLKFRLGPFVMLGFAHFEALFDEIQITRKQRVVRNRIPSALIRHLSSMLIGT